MQKKKKNALHKNKFILLQSHHVSLLKTEDVRKIVPTMERLLSVRVEHLTSNLAVMENLVIRFIHVTNQTTVDALTNVRRKEIKPNAAAMMDVN